jgi:hypothetical protein
LLSDFQHALGDLSDGFWLERCATLYRNVDVRDRKFFSAHHVTSPINVRQRATKGNNLALRDVSVLPEILEPKPKRIARANQCRFASAMSAFGGKADIARGADVGPPYLLDILVYIKKPAAERSQSRSPTQ